MQLAPQLAFNFVILMRVISIQLLCHNANHFLNACMYFGRIAYVTHPGCDPGQLIRCGRSSSVDQLPLDIAHDAVWYDDAFVLTAESFCLYSGPRCSWWWDDGAGSTSTESSSFKSSSESFVLLSDSVSFRPVCLILHRVAIA